MAFAVVNTATNSWTHVSHLDSGELGLLQLLAECGRWAWGARGAEGTVPQSLAPQRPWAGEPPGQPVLPLDVSKGLPSAPRGKEASTSWVLHGLVFTESFTQSAVGRSWGSRSSEPSLPLALWAGAAVTWVHSPGPLPWFPWTVGSGCPSSTGVSFLSQPENMFSINRWVKMERSICLTSALRGVLCYIHTYLCKSFKQCVFHCGFYFLSHSDFIFWYLRRVPIFVPAVTFIVIYVSDTWSSLFFVIGFLLWAILKLATVVFHSIWFELISFYSWVSQVAVGVKNLLASAGDVRDVGLIPGLGRSSGGGHGNTLQFLAWRIPMNRETWRAAVHRVTQSWTWLKQLSTHARLLHSDIN